MTTPLNPICHHPLTAMIVRYGLEECQECSNEIYWDFLKRLDEPLKREIHVDTGEVRDVNTENHANSLEWLKSLQGGE